MLPSKPLNSDGFLPLATPFAVPLPLSWLPLGATLSLLPFPSLCDVAAVGAELVQETDVTAAPVASLAARAVGDGDKAVVVTVS